MSKGRQAQAVGSSIEAFREAVREILIREHGMSSIVADAYLASDPEFVEGTYSEPLDNDLAKAVWHVAEELAGTSSKQLEWIRLDEHTLVIHTNPQVKKYLEHLVCLGLYGAEDADVAERMMCRGMEEVLRSFPSKRELRNEDR